MIHDNHVSELSSFHSIYVSVSEHLMEIVITVRVYGVFMVVVYEHLG